MKASPNIRGTIQVIADVIISIFLWFKMPSWEKPILEIISKDQNAFTVFGSYWNNVVQFLLNYWEIISIVILLEGLYAIIYDRNLISDVVAWLRKNR